MLALRNLVALVALTATCFAQGPDQGSGTGVTNGSDGPRDILLLNVKVMLSGPFSGGSMTTTLNSLALIPAAQPYNVAPWNYSGTETASPIPADAVDWVLVELRAGTSPGSRVGRRAGFVRSDGIIVDNNGTQFAFSGIAPGTYYVVILHRNHLAIMSGTPVSLSGSPPPLYDFTTAQTQAYGTNPMKLLSGGTLYGMYAGDVNADGVVKYNLTGNDRGLILARIGGTNINAMVSGYYREDVSMDGVVKYNLTGNDRGIILQSIGGTNINATTSTQVP